MTVILKWLFIVIVFLAIPLFFLLIFLVSSYHKRVSRRQQNLEKSDQTKAT